MIQTDADSRWDERVSCDGGEKWPDAECISKAGFLTQAVRSMVLPSTEMAKAVGGTGFGATGGHAELEEEPTSTQEAGLMDGWQAAGRGCVSLWRLSAGASVSSVQRDSCQARVRLVKVLEHLARNKQETAPHCCVEEGSPGARWGHT